MSVKNRRGDWHYPLSKDCLRGAILRASGGVERMQLQSVTANANTKAEEDSFPAAQPCESSTVSGGMLADHAAPAEQAGSPSR